MENVNVETRQTLVTPFSGRLFRSRFSTLKANVLLNSLFCYANRVFRYEESKRGVILTRNRYTETDNTDLLIDNRRLSFFMD